MLYNWETATTAAELFGTDEEETKEEIKVYFTDGTAAFFSAEELDYFRAGPGVLAIVYAYTGKIIK